MIVFGSDRIDKIMKQPSKVFKITPNTIVMTCDPNGGGVSSDTAIVSAYYHKNKMYICGLDFHPTDKDQKTPFIQAHVRALRAVDRFKSSKIVFIPVRDFRHTYVLSYHHLWRSPHVRSTFLERDDFWRSFWKGKQSIWCCKDTHQCIDSIQKHTDLGRECDPMSFVLSDNHWSWRYRRRTREVPEPLQESRRNTPTVPVNISIPNLFSSIRKWYVVILGQNHLREYRKQSMSCLHNWNNGRWSSIPVCRLILMVSLSIDSDSGKTAKAKPYYTYSGEIRNIHRLSIWRRRRRSYDSLS